MDIYRKTFAEIDLLALENNVNWLKNNFPQNPLLCPMVKGNAYGHGDYIIAKALSDLKVPSLGVCLIEEGLWLKQSGINTPILVFRGFDNEGAKEIIANDFIPVVSQWEQIDYLENNYKGKPISVHLKFDTGMNRLGFSMADSAKLYDRFWQNKKLRLKALVTHLYQGEDFLLEEGHSQNQLAKIFEVEKVFQSFQPQIHALNTAGIVGAYLKRKPWYSRLGLRPGLLIYGYSPKMLNSEAPTDFLMPVMTLKSQISDIKFVPKGAGVSYSHTWKAAKDSKIAIIPIGYADGVHRLLSNKGRVIVKNQYAPIIGTICMDYLMVDLSDLDQSVAVSKNDEVVLLGMSENKKCFISASEQALHAQTITWEILTSIGIRVPRVITERSREIHT